MRFSTQSCLNLILYYKCVPHGLCPFRSHDTKWSLFKWLKGVSPPFFLIKHIGPHSEETSCSNWNTHLNPIQMLLNFTSCSTTFRNTRILQVTKIVFRKMWSPDIEALLKSCALYQHLTVMFVKVFSCLYHHIILSCDLSNCFRSLWVPWWMIY